MEPSLAVARKPPGSSSTTASSRRPDPTVPLLERVKCFAIVSSNLDEFFMVRVAGLKRLIGAGAVTAGPDGLVG